MVFSVVVFFHPFFTAFVIMQYLLGFKLFLAEKKGLFIFISHAYDEEYTEGTLVSG